MKPPLISQQNDCNENLQPLLSLRATNKLVVGSPTTSFSLTRLVQFNSQTWLSIRLSQLIFAAQAPKLELMTLMSNLPNKCNLRYHSSQLA